MSKGDCVGYPETPCRVNLDLMPEGTSLWMYGLTAVASLIFAYGIWQMIAVWRLGRTWKPGDLKAGLKRMVVAVMSHKKFQQQPKPGTSHKWLFLGFLALFIGTTLAFIDMDIFEQLDAKLLKGPGYLAYELALDFFGILFLIGIGFLAWRRYRERPKQLHNTTLPESPWLKVDADLMALTFLFLIGLTGFFMEALRLRHQITTDGIAYAHWSFAGNALGLIFFKNLSVTQIESVYPMLWWFHFAMWISIMAILPWTKLKHIFTSSLNIMFHDPTRQARAALPTPFDLQAMMESGDMDVPDPVTTIRDFTWKDRLAFDACTNCGRCEAVCPADAAGRPLSPRKLIQDLKAAMWDDYREGKKAGADHKPKSLTEAVGANAIIEEATLWSCTTCRACMTECPVDIEHVDIITEMRRGLVNSSKLDEHQQKLLVNLTNAGNPYGFPMTDRDAWRAGLPPGVVVPTAAEKVAAGEGVELLWWVGCSGSFDPRNNEVTKSVATLLNAAGIDFCILGNDEKCTGDPARRLGEEGRFQQSVIENLAVLQAHGVKKILTQCPHCFNTLQNEYPEFGGDFEVMHHTQFLEQLIEEGKLPLTDGDKMEVTYHDSCYLGRHNGIFDAPRNTLEKAGFPVIEMAANREKGLCCGAGGSNMWYEVEQEDRINIIRAKQAADTGAGTVVSACPFCLTMVSDGIGLTGNEGKMVAKDLSELLVERLDWTPPVVEVAATDASDDLGGWSG